ncbi:hypothetical protein GM3708_652 [Geminocystis sp. NIES-3708]|uniref:hypothetical protein n=1 Tax=Geminocystis sp. NIES-3708 TaxID=1615909 RepID=UPI0005FCA874|nr:hypothetical protein [Geminocystis sp. NIES-3708]BAQ60246.1 hypothetical protein GM3708_652 [Geminocystis sp. NIES-3708]
MTKPEKDIELERDILKDRKFSLAELIGKEGGSFLKGESPVPKIVQLKTEIKLFISNNLKDLSGALQAVLNDKVDGEDEKISSHQEKPLQALQLMIEEIISNEHIYHQFVKQVDLKWGNMNGERPHFQLPGQPPHPDDEYTHESVKTQLINLLKIIPK